MPRPPERRGSDTIQPVAVDGGEANVGEVPVAFCPRCGAALAGPESFVQEFWVASETAYHCWCRNCSFVWNLVLVDRMTSHELAH